MNTPLSRPPFVRMQHIHDRLRAAEQVNATVIARELETSPRTIQRDLEFMRDSMGLPIEYEPTAHSFVYTFLVDPAIFSRQPPAWLGQSAALPVAVSAGEGFGLPLDEEPAEHLAIICERHGLHAKDVLRAVIGNTLADAVCDSMLMAALVRTARSLAVLDDSDEQREAA